MKEKLWAKWDFFSYICFKLPICVWMFPFSVFLLKSNMSLTLNKRENKPIMYLMSAYKFFVKDWERNKESQRKKIEVIHDWISHKDVQNCLWLWVLSQLVRCFPSQNRLLKEIMGQSRQCRLKLFIVIFPLMTTSLTCFCKLTHIHQ